jgi:hypothetical protein
MTVARSSTYGSMQRDCISAYAARRNRCTLPVSRTPAMGTAWLKRTSTSFIVSCMRVFGRCNLRVAIAASLASRKRFETWVVAPKTSSERIVFSDRWKLIFLVSTLIALDSFRACAMPESDGNGKSGDVIELRELSVPRVLGQDLAHIQLPVEISTAAKISTPRRQNGHQRGRSHLAPLPKAGVQHIAQACANDERTDTRPAAKDALT